MFQTTNQFICKCQDGGTFDDNIPITDLSPSEKSAVVTTGTPH